jgi:hypothetical protein
MKSKKTGPRWKAKGPKPKTRFCWNCSRQLYGRQHRVITGPDGHQHDVHIRCNRFENEEE